MKLSKDYGHTVAKIILTTDKIIYRLVVGDKLILWDTDKIEDIKEIQL
jgi:hypothetical protein